MRTVRWNHTSKKLFLFIVSLLVIIPAFTITAIATDQTTDSFTKPYPLGLSILAFFGNNNTTKGTLGGIAPLGGSDAPSGSDSDIISISGSNSDDDNYPSTPDTNQPDTSTIADSMAEKIQCYTKTLSACATEIKPMLSLKCPDGVAAGSMFKVLVTSDGMPVEKALVSFIDQNVLTDKNGAAYLQAPKVSEDLKIPITARKEGYGNYTTYIHIIVTHVEVAGGTSSVNLIDDSSSQGDYSLVFSQPRLFFQNLFDLTS